MFWSPAPGVLELPSGRRVRGRSIRRPARERADFSLYLLAFPPRPHRITWRSRDRRSRQAEEAYAWLCWPDFGLPVSRRLAGIALAEAYARTARERVEVCCAGGVGRTGTALACLAILDGLPPGPALELIRTQYQPHAVETPWQRNFLFWFAKSG